MILGPRGVGSCQSGWTILELTADEVQTLFAGHFKINPPEKPDAFMGYKGAVKKDGG